MTLAFGSKVCRVYRVGHQNEEREKLTEPKSAQNSSKFHLFDLLILVVDITWLVPILCPTNAKVNFLQSKKPTESLNSVTTVC